MRAIAFILGIVVGAVGCDKPGANPPAPNGEPFDIDSSPVVVFHVFGERGDVRMMPLLTVRGNALASINLDADGWRTFDERYLRPGMSYDTYRDGRPSGRVTVTRGMWEGDALYSLPQCRTAIPMAAVTLSDTLGSGAVVSQFATTRADSAAGRRAVMAPDTVRAIARRVGAVAGATVEISPGELDALDFRAIAIATGTNAQPTIVVTFIDPQLGDQGPGRGNTQHVFVLADDDGTGYAASYAHAVNGDASRAEMRGFIDHFDISGDGISEVVVAASVPGRDATTRVLAWRDGTWREVFAARESWCLDPRGR